MLTPRHFRATRALLGWSAGELAARPGVQLSTVQLLERSRDRIHGTAFTLEGIQITLEAAGIEFLDPRLGVGVRLKPLAEQSTAP